MKRRYILSAVAALALAVIAALAFGTSPEEQEPSISLLADAGSFQAFDSVRVPREFDFPVDHGPHETFQTEWWYYTGNLEASSGERFGYQLTIFRRGLSPGPVTRESALAADQVYFGHLALTDIEAQTHWATERFSRGSGGLAGASGEPYAVFIEDWKIESLDETGNEIRLQAGEGDFDLDLVLTAAKPIVAHGESGLSRKGDQVGNASYYLSFTDLPTLGTIRVAGEEFAVEGSSWFDHEWGTSALGPNAVGWDWFGLQLDDGRELMIILFRAADGSVDPISGGTLVDSEGNSRWMSLDQFKIEPTGSWTSDESGATYPSGWRITVPSEAIDLNIEPYVLDQEMLLNIVYWEGAVQITGSSTGRGYVELTGYVAGIGGLF